MKMIVLLTLLGSALAVDVNAEVLHWVGGGGSGTGDFNVPANWQEGKVPGESDLAAVNNNVNKNWAVTLDSDVTNSIVSLIAPSPDYETLFVMDQHVWTVTNYVSVWEASGGRITFTNGTLRSKANGFAPGYGTLVTKVGPADEGCTMAVYEKRPNTKSNEEVALIRYSNRNFDKVCVR